MKITFTKKFEKQAEKLPTKKLKEEVVSIIDLVEASNSIQEIKNLKKLKGFNNYFRIRMGEYRIGIYLNKGIIEFAAIDHRKDIYKYFP
ncbi:MAG: type II toxin-antitoxin system RelE/ParE family toxin [Bacteroidetes bacterium]|nr:type II toxin-antitoxin system RelE/ParE family toxin [Bacteroidota bacterium]